MITGRCLACGYAFDAASGLVDPAARPGPGDATLCLNCAHVMIFTPFGVRNPTPGELAEVLADEQARASVGYIRSRGFIPGVEAR